MALPNKRIKKVQLPGDVQGDKTYDIVPEMLGKDGYSAELPTLTENSRILLDGEAVRSITSGSVEGIRYIEDFAINASSGVSEAITAINGGSGTLYGSYSSSGSGGTYRRTLTLFHNHTQASASATTPVLTQVTPTKTIKYLVQNKTAAEEEAAGEVEQYTSNALNDVLY